MRLTGIENENEYFPRDFFADSLKEIISESSRREEVKKSIDRLQTFSKQFRTEYREMQRDNTREKRRELTRKVIEALGYTYQREGTSVDEEGLIPTISTIHDTKGRDAIWIVECPDCRVDEPAHPLSLTFKKEQFLDGDVLNAILDKPMEDLLGGIFQLGHPPEYVFVVNAEQLVVTRRHKWSERAVLRFNFKEVFEDENTVAATACFASRETLQPNTGIPLSVQLEEEAQRKTNAVTSSLKETVRDAIEKLGQEVLDVTNGKYPRGHTKNGQPIDGEELTRECLRYMYRLLFLFYAEAKPELGVLNLKNPVYRLGYSLETLRTYESKRLVTGKERKGTFLWQSLQKVLELAFTGTIGRTSHKLAFRLNPINFSLLDPLSTPILTRVKLRNAAVQEIIRLLSLKQDRKGTGRISYAHLGIGQLGAVYETLISFTGFIASTDLIEVKQLKGKDKTLDKIIEDNDEYLDEQEDTVSKPVEQKLVPKDLLAPSYFVPLCRAAEFGNKRIVCDGKQPRIYKKGTFIYRLAGRDREKAAAYYTPEPLARLLVKHTLLERCKNLKANEILELKILEPAMGSAAFLVETVNQLADLYLERKQEEVDQTIPQTDYTNERQKVRTFIADRNCFGVDLNPIATELGAISLWLNSLHDGDFSPWFGDQLHGGNSLLGARHATYPPESLVKRGNGSWLKKAPPPRNELRT